MKIVFFGTSDFGSPILETLNRIDDFEIVSIVTQPDKKQGRKQILTPSPIKILAKELEIEVLQPSNKKEIYEMLKDITADFFIVVSYGMILPKKILDLPKVDSINIHASLLPKYRGASPIQESLLNGDQQTGISIMKMHEELDAGDLYLVKRVAIEKDDDSIILGKRLSQAASQMLPLILEDIYEQNLTAVPQDDSQATFCKKIKKQDGEIDFKKSAKEIQDMLRAYTPWPGIYTEFQGKKIKILKSDISDEKNPAGEFILDDQILKIGTKHGSLIPKKVQPEGKKEMDIQSFVNGYKDFLSRT